jgi:lysophospholipase L1-like esterase
MRVKPILLLVLLGGVLASAQTIQTKPGEPGLEKYTLLKAPEPTRLVLKPGDRLAICGDSITEQKMYSRLMEDYLTMCVPELKITVRQYGWSGERAPGFLARMTNDCLRFEPTLATTCYGMNDHEYRPYEDRIGKTYRENSTAIDEAFKSHGVRVIEGSAGCVGKMPGWVKSANGTVEDLNLNLCQLRNIGIEVAQSEGVGFADVFWPMLTAGITAQREYGTNYAIAGRDGVHPGWAGHTIMAYAFLKSMGLPGDIGTFTVDLKRNKLKASKGHEVLSAKDGEFEIRSSRYPFIACEETPKGDPGYPTCAPDDVSKDSTIRSGMSLVPFNQDLNRLMLVANNGQAAGYKITWGMASKSFTAEQLKRGINLAAEFPCNPFCEAFAKVDAAVAAKQAYETKQIKQSFRSPEAKTDMAAVVKQTEEERAPLEAAIRQAFVPVTHTLKIVAE